MANKDLTDFIQKQRATGMDDAEIRRALTDNGWVPTDVDQGFTELAQGTSTDAAMALPPLPAVEPLQSAETQPMQLPDEQPLTLATATAVEPHGEPEDIFAAVSSTPDQQMSSPATMPIDPAALDMAPAQMENNAPGQVETMPSVAAIDPQQVSGGTAEPGVKPIMKDGMGLGAKIGVFAAIIVVIGGLIAGGVYGYYQFFQSPDRMLQLAMGSIADLESFSYSASMGTDTEALVLQGQTTTVMATEATKSTSSTSADGASMETRSIGGHSYMKIHMPEGEVPAAAVTSIADQWISLDQADGDLSRLGLVGPSVTSSVYNAEEAKQFMESLRSASLFNIQKPVAKEEIGGVKTQKYPVSLNQEGVKAWLATVQALSSAEEMAPSFTDMVGGSTATGYIWIGTGDYQIYKIEGELTSSDGENNAISIVFSNHNTPFTVEVPADAITMEEYAGMMMPTLEVPVIPGTTDMVVDETVVPDVLLPTDEDMPVVDLPVDTDGDTILDIDEDLVGTDPLLVDTDDDGLDDAEEEVYGTDPLDPDTDGDTYLDGDEVASGYNPLGEGELIVK